jgi:hypothetical protein
MANDETQAKKQRAFISALHEFFNVAHKCNADSKLQDIMEEESLEKNLMDDIVSGKELVNRLLGAISNVDLKTEINKSFRLLKESAETLEDNQWTSQLQSLTKESLIKTTFAVELVRRDWLKAKENQNLLEAITQLPLRPYRDLFNDLFKVHVVSGPRVDENISKDLKKKTQRFSENDRGQTRVRKCAGISR